MSEKHNGNNNTNSNKKQEVPKDSPVYKSARRVSIAAAEARDDGGSQNQPSAQRPEEKVETQEK